MGLTDYSGLIFDAVVTFVSVFLGFLLALYANRLQERSRIHSDRARLVSMFRQDMERLYKDLHDVNGGIKVHGYVFDSARASGKLSLLNEKELDAVWSVYIGIERFNDFKSQMESFRMMALALRNPDSWLISYGKQASEAYSQYAKEIRKKIKIAEAALSTG